NIIEGNHSGQQNGQNGLATGLSISGSGTGVTDPTVTVNIFNNFFSGLGNDAIRFEGGKYNAYIAQNFIGNGVRTYILTPPSLPMSHDPDFALISMAIPGYVGKNAIPLDPNQGNGIFLTSGSQGSFTIKENYLAGNGFANNPPGLGGPNFDLNVAF